MMKKYFYSILDGCLQGIIFILFIDFIASPFWSGLNLSGAIIFVLFIALSIASSLLIINKSQLHVLRFSLISFVFFVIFLVLSFINNFELKIRLFPRRELGNADGIIIIFLITIYLIILFIEKITIPIFFAIKKRQIKTGDGSLIDTPTNEQSNT